MAVSHKTNNNLINCNRCHLPYNLKNAVPKMLTCKHWYCFNCLEYYLHTAKDTEKYIECINCQRSIENMQGVYNHDKLNMSHNNNNLYYKQINQINQINNNNNNKSDNNSSNSTTSYGCEDELFIQLDYELMLNNNGGGGGGNNNNKSSTASLASEENSIGSFTYFNNNGNHIANNTTTNGTDLEASMHFGNRGISSAGTEKMLPGENCFIHGMPNTLWCQTCLAVLCRGCNAGLEHKDHKVENQLEAKEYYQNRVKQEFMQIQMSVEEMENLQALQKNFLLKLLDTCCSLKLQIEHELMANAKATEVDDMKDTVKNLQLCFGLLGRQTPNEILKLYKIIKDENAKLKMKHKLLLQQCRMQQLLIKSQRILDFDMMKEFCQKLDSSESNLTKQKSDLMESGENNNSLMMLTNYCIYRVYISYMRQQQQFIEEQVLRYQQYHQEQKQQNLLKQYKMLQQHNLSTLSLQNQNQQHHHESQNGNNNNSFYNHDKEDKPKTYAEIATSQNAHQFNDLNDNTTTTTQTTTTNGFATTNNFQPYRKPLNKSYEEPRKTVQLLFNPINNENNQIYFFDFERNGLHLGRVLIKVFADIAPKMSYNFHALATHEKGFGYIGCKVFECHPNESIITGDIEQNTGYSSRSIYEDVQFVPDDTNIAPFAGAVGMRRAKKKFHSQGLVGSQFRIILTELGFTAIFGCVIEGIDVIKKISQTLVQNDKIHGSNGNNSQQQNTTIGTGTGTGTMNNTVGQISSNGTVAGIYIAQCGLYEFVKRDIMCGI